MDTTYFGRKWGVMVLYDARSKRALTVVAVERETNAPYTQEVAALQEKRGGGYKALSAMAKAACWVPSRIYPCRCANFTKSKSSCAT